MAQPTTHQHDDKTTNMLLLEDEQLVKSIPIRNQIVYAVILRDGIVYLVYRA